MMNVFRSVTALIAAAGAGVALGAGPAEAVAPAATTAKLEFTAAGWGLTVDSARPSCEQNRRVVLIQEYTDDDVRSTVVRTNRLGKYPLAGLRGNYFLTAYAPATSDCKAAISNRVWFQGRIS